MKRYYENEDDDEFLYGEDGHFGDPDGQQTFNGFVDQQDIMNVMQFDLSQIELNQYVLDKAVEIAASSFWWKFKSAAKRLEEINLIAVGLIKIIEGDKPPEGPDVEMTEPEEEDNADV